MSQSYQDFFKTAKKVRGRPVVPAEKSPAQRRKPQKAKNAPPFFAVLGIVCGCVFLGTLGWVIYEDGLIEGFGGLKLSLGQALAKEQAEETASQLPTKTENSAALSGGPEAATTKEKAEKQTEDVSYFSKLVERKDQLDQREQDLNRLEEELQKQRVSIENQIERLETLRGEVSEILKDRVELDQERVNKLVEMYSNMKPKQAAEVFETLNERLAIEVLGRMKKQNAAQILNLIDKEKAKALTEKFAGYQGVVE